MSVIKLFPYLCITVILYLTPIVHAALIFEPSAPWVVSGGKIQVRTTNAIKPLTWTAEKGSIVGFPNGIGATYTTPLGVETALDVVSVVDAAGNTGTINILVQPQTEVLNRFKPENAHWELYPNSTDIPGVGSISTDGLGGVWAVPVLSNDERPKEELTDLFYRDAEKNWIVNGSAEFGNIKSLAPDAFGGLWLGGLYNALFYLDKECNWSKRTYIFDSILGVPSPLTHITSDGTGGLWVVAEDIWDDGFLTQFNVSLHHIDAEGNLLRNIGYWLYPAGSSSYFYRYGRTYGVSSLHLDGMDGLWISFYIDKGLQHIDAAGNWTSYRKDLYISDTGFDDTGDLWITTRGNGLQHLDANGNWTLYDTDNSDLPSNDLSSLHTDNAGGLWIGTTENGLVHRDIAGNWSVYDTGNSELPNNFIYEILSDSTGGLWIKSGDGIFDDGWNTELTYLSFDQKNKLDLPAAPILNRYTLVNGQHLHASLPASSENQDSYVAVAMPDGTLLLLNDLNTGQVFINELLLWQGGDIVLDFSVNDGLPRGEYTLFLLRVPTGNNPLADTSAWQLGMNTFVVK
jgi:hypothetical protein